MSTAILSFMGEGEPEGFRCRVYADGDEQESARLDFVRQLATAGVIDAPAWDPWIDALAARGYVVGELEPNPDGPGRIKRWRLTPLGHEALLGDGEL